jgi:ATP-dependent helicase HrpB
VSTELPIVDVLPNLRAVLASGTCAVVQAPPGTGKTTLIPLALRDEAWLDGRTILMLEPRRLAARAAAQRMADLLGEDVGATVGYRIRLDACVSQQTRIEVVTEGILTRRLQNDPELNGVGCVIFDEFHERSVHADLGLALSLDVQQSLRSDLRILVMSATLETHAVAALLDEAPIIAAKGRVFDVRTIHAARASQSSVEQRVIGTVLTALAEQPGDMLVFLPGAAEIQRVHRALQAQVRADAAVLPLYANLTRAAQDRAIRASPTGQRKIVLATTIAETSLTIEGVRVVVDSGLTRGPRFDPRRGLTRLETMRVSRAAAEQRRGRAGRLAPGVCYRLWTEAEHANLPAAPTPEIRAADLTPLALELAAWGVADPQQLRWLDPPPAGAFAHARALLRDLGALDADGTVNAHGRAMIALPLHPRLAHMVLAACERDLGSLACSLAALISEPGAGPRGDPDICAALEALHAGRSEWVRARATARILQRTLRLPPLYRFNPADVGRTLAFAYPDRIALRRAPASLEFLLANGRAARLIEPCTLMHHEYLVVVDLDAGERTGRIHLAAPYTLGDLLNDIGGRIETTEHVVWDTSRGALVAQRLTRYGAIILKEEPLLEVAEARRIAAVLDGIRKEGLECLPWNTATRQLQARILFMRAVDPRGDWPDVSDAALLRNADTMLAPFLGQVRRRSDLGDTALDHVLTAQLAWRQRRALDDQAPTHYVVPSGARIRLEYGTQDAPVLAVRIQELFGLTTTPTVAGGRVPVIVQLLSPARRPVQVTRDLAGFWRTTYAHVRKELRGRYPKHAWPEDPTTATPQRGVRRRA